jgi:signal transduction histidine kinase
VTSGAATARPVRLPAALPLASALVTGVLAAAGALSLWFVTPQQRATWHVLWALVVGAGFATAGCAVVARDRASVPGRLLAAAAVLVLAGPPLVALGAPRAAASLVVLGVAGLVPPAILRVVPHGRLRPVLRWLEVGVAAAALVAAAGAAAGTTTGTTTGWGAGLASATLTFCAGWLLFEQSAGDDRRRMLWVVLGVSATVPGVLLFVVLADRIPIGAIGVVLVVGVLSLMLPLALAVALLAPRAVDVRAVIRGGVVATVMTTLVVAVWSTGEALVDLWGPGEGVPGYRGVLVAAIAAAFHPVLVRVRSLTDELLFGGRADPVDTLTRLGTHLVAGSAPRDWLETLRATLAVPGIELRAPDGVVAVSGTVADATETTPLVTGADRVGDLVVALPADQLRLPPATRAVLGLVAPPLAQAMHAVRLGEQLQESRRRVVTVLEEERRRVRRDLHDGLGPTLTGIAYSADAAANLAGADPDAAVRLLRELRADAGEAIAEVRRIVYGLRPRALDELGLVGAVRQRVEHLHATGGQALRVTVDAPAELPELSAAVEVAAYRVAVEAVTNVARHAAVDAARVTFALPDAGLLRVTVADAGVSDGDWRHGVGLGTMRERVEGVGGVLTVTAGPGGAVVTADLPIGENGV